MAATKRPAGINFEKILQSVKTDIQEMVHEYQESNLPVNDDCKNLHQLCDRLEFILKFGIKERSVLGGRRDLWQYFCKCLSERRNILEGLKMVKANKEIKTSVGRSRSFLRYCLVHQCLADVIQQCTENKSMTNYFYLQEALMLDETLVSSLLGSLYHLCDVPFDLPPTGHDLDVSWPTFARPGSSAWGPPSRTMSMSSLSSFSSQLSEAVSYQSPSLLSNMAPVGEDEPTHDCPSTPVSPISPSHTSPDTNLKGSLEEISQLHQRLSYLEDDNASLRASNVSLQLKLNQVQQEMPITTQESSSEKESESRESTKTSQDEPVNCLKCAELNEELQVSKNRSSELETLQQKLESQVKALEKQFEESERKKTEYEQQISTLQSQLNSVICDKTNISVKEECTVQVSEDSISVQKDELSMQNSPNSASDHSESSLECAESLEEYRERLQDLETRYNALQEQCRAIENERTTMRTNIHKVSANWFERKTRVSEGEGEGPPKAYPLESSSSGNKKDDQINQLNGSDFTSEYMFWMKRMKDVPKLLAEISFLHGKLDLTEKMCSELRKRVREYENVIDDQEIIIHGMKDQMDTYFNDNQKMSKQLSALTKLFEDIELTEKTKVNLVNPPENSNTVTNNLPNGEDFKEMSNSLSKTYIKLKELILEKKSLVTEIERLNVLNVELQRRVCAQENRLISVSDALHTTWIIVSDVKEQHAQLHTSESILRYELKEKRELLHRLREELEVSREQWHKIRQMNSKSEEEWNTMREELDERRRVAENVNESREQDHYEGATALQSSSDTSKEFEPPVDLLLDMAIEYGVMEADDEASTAMVAAIEGEDMHSSRLQDLEDQCSYLYQKLMASTSRSLTLASRLNALHEHYGSSDEDDDYDDDDDDYDDDDDDDEPFVTYETEEVVSPEPESYDTAYVSEADTGSASGVPGIISEEEMSGSNSRGNGTEENAVNGICVTEEQSVETEDDLCRGLINFLPRKIEILRRDNQKLEERYLSLQEEKLHSEAQLKASLETEKIIRQQLEEKLEHLGKCVDELKLERNGQISEAEEKLKQKVASLSQREKEYDTLQDDLKSLTEKFEQRGIILQAANERVNQLEKDLAAKEASAHDSLTQLDLAKNQANEFKVQHEELNSEYKELKNELLDLQQQITDLRFQLSSNTMEREAVQKADVEKTAALDAANAQVIKLESTLIKCQEESASQYETLLAEQKQIEVQVEKLNRILTDRDQECSGLRKQLQEAEESLATAKNSLSDTQFKLGTQEETSNQLNGDNENLREKVIQLLSRRVRVCDDCFSIHAELATIIATLPHHINEGNTNYSESGACGESTSQKSRSAPICSKQPDDEEFSLISDDEVQNSRLSSSPSSGSPVSNEVITETRATSDILTTNSLAESPPTNAEVWISAGTRVLVPVDLPAGITLNWHFSSEPKSVSFAVLHQPTLANDSVKSDNQEISSSSSQQRVLIPTTRVASAEGATVKGRLLTKQPGVYTLVFDNSCSRYTAKKVTYSLKLENNSSAISTSSSSSSASQASALLPVP